MSKYFSCGIHLERLSSLTVAYWGGWRLSALIGRRRGLLSGNNRYASFKEFQRTTDTSGVVSLVPTWGIIRPDKPVSAWFRLKPCEDLSGSFWYHCQRGEGRNVGGYECVCYVALFEIPEGFLFKGDICQWMVSRGLRAVAESKRKWIIPALGSTPILFYP